MQDLALEPLNNVSEYFDFVCQTILKSVAIEKCQNQIHNLGVKHSTASTLQPLL